MAEPAAPYRPVSANDHCPVAALLVRGLRVAYGGIEAVKGIDLEVHEGELVALIGANGAGKTSTLKAITGALPLRSGTVTLFGEPTHALPGHQLVGKGLVMVPEGRGIFARMTILENLEMGAFVRRDSAAIADDIDRMLTLFPRLRERTQQLAGTLSGGEQQMLAIGRALMAQPRLLLLDEPSMGLAPILVEKIFAVIRQVARQGTTILLVEQNARLALQCANRGYVMESGTIGLQGPAQSLLDDPAVRSAYLGEES
jgi:branched-chain amino acid transport system ATP-binding protein